MANVTLLTAKSETDFRSLIPVIYQGMMTKHPDDHQTLLKML